MYVKYHETGTSMSLKLNIIIALALLTSACVNFNNKTDAPWPAEIPEQSYFIEYYKVDANEQRSASLERYLSWVKQFYFGSTFYKNGWLKVTKTAVISLDSEKDKQVIQQKMTHLGKIISPEWSKTTKTRAIYTRHMSIWGSGLLEAIEENEQIAYIDKVTLDVHALLNRKISPDDINNERYYATRFEEDDVFQ